MNKIEHIGIAVSDLGLASDTFEKLLNRKSYKTEDVASESVRTEFFQLGESKLELLGSLDEKSAIASFLSKNRPGMHHIAIAVDDINAEIDRLKSLGFSFVSETPKKGADNKRIVFLHPKSTQGVLVELCEEIEKDR
ncbi:MAG: methylmalonyl-CoA epimerase [Flavobacteriaceae bacterium]|nr:methylmalonyl-CoA epimerase [Bacteroidota bacterium]MDT8415603.1 methylmalonyl-CoA epimerase [Flavobacteriaceae bacterium]